MRIAFVSQEYPPETGSGGIGTQAFQKAHGLAERGHSVHVISHSSDEKRHEYQTGRVHIIRIPGFDGELSIATDAARWLTYSTQVATEVARLHSEVNLDLVELPEWGSEGYVHLLNQTEWNRIPTAIHLHGPIVMFAVAIGWPDPNSTFYHVARHMEETCLRLADAVYSSSRCSAEWCAKHYGLNLESIPVLHTGVDTEVFRPRSVPKEDRPTIVFVGKIERNKGICVLVDAACRLADDIPDLRLRLFGRGGTGIIRELTETAVSKGYPKLLEFPGYVARQELAEHLSRAHVFAAPSVYEGGPGFVYLEAMACGLPVIACTGSGASEVVLDGETGYLIAPGDVDAVRGVLALLLSDEEARCRMGRCARQFVERQADSRECLQQLESFYAGVIERCRDRAPQFRQVSCHA